MVNTLTLADAASVRVPVVHLNGTGAAGLTEQYFAAYDALRVALEALNNAAPNQRDYYVARPDADLAWQEAVAQHRARLLAVNAVQEQLAALILGVTEQGGR